MTLIVRLLALLIISSANIIVSMNDDKIFFRINKELKIWCCTSCNSFTTKNCNESCRFEDWKSCDITQILPLSEEKKREINQALITVENTKLPVDMTYDHDNKSYKVTIQFYKGEWTKYTVVVEPNAKKN